MAQRGRPKKEKDPWEGLDESIRENMESATDEEIRSRISLAALDQAAMEAAMKDDQDLAEKKEQAKIAMEPYNESKKRFKLLVRFGRSLLSSRGKEAGISPLEQ